MISFDSAVAFMKKAHCGQKDKGGNPYYLHPLSVAHLVSAFSNDEEVVIAAILHDVLEDTEYTALDMASAGVSQRTIDIVTAVSRNKTSGLTYIQWISSIAASGDSDAILVKLCDNLHNSMPERLSALPAEEKGISRRYDRARAILTACLKLKMKEEQE